VQTFSGRTAVVTGGASGIGLAICERLAREGMRIVLADVEAAALSRAVERVEALGVEALGVVTDVSDFDSVRNLEARAVEAFGRVHVLCNNAGVGAHEDNDWRWTFAVNVWGVIHGLRAFVPGMLAHGEEGHVVNTSSGNGGLTLLPSTPIYSTSKSAVSTLTEVLHMQLVQRQARIRASVLYPGPHLVTSNIFDAARNRPERYAREIPQVAEKVTLETLRQLADRAGFELQTTTPAEVADHFFDGLRNDAYYILPPSEEMDGRIRTRLEGLLKRRDPEVPAF
jgi:NAD(P)-dependent dehydrogenase (short-subunit alcohol dehydrogenase family)